MLTAGRLRDRIEILERTVSKTALGNLESWDTSRTLWGTMSGISISSKASFQQAFNNEVTHRVIFRGRVALSVRNNRLRWREKTYQIISAEHDVAGQGQFTIINAKRLDDGNAAS